MSRSSRKNSKAKIRLNWRSWALLLVLCISWSAAWAQEGSGIPDERVAERLAFIENALYSGQGRAKTWWSGWISGYAAGAVVMGGLAAGHRDDKKFAQDMWVGSGTLALGVAGLLVDPFVPAYGPNKLRAMPEGTAEDRRLKLEKAEELLRECAKRERDGRGLITHLLNLGANAAAGLVTVWAFDRPWSDGLVTFATGEAVSLLNIFSQPRRAVHDLNNYEAKYLGKRGSDINPRGNAGFQFAPYPGGFIMRVSF